MISLWFAKRGLPLLAALFFFCPTLVSGAPLTISNATTHDILNILATAPGQEYYFRLDLQPDAIAEVENPHCKADLRFDTGLALYRFSTLNLAKIKMLILKPGAKLVIEDFAGKLSEVKGHEQLLTPQAGDQPVCHLSRFHPAMSMKDVCSFLPAELPKDDNGALLTGMGFAGLTWAARLVPEAAPNNPVTEDSRLEHMELRRQLTKEDLTKLVEYLLNNGYCPWQAELPGLEVEFSEQASPSLQQEVLLNTLARFLARNSHQEHIGQQRKCDQATIIFAPKALLPELETAEEPREEVDIYTITLRPCTQTLMVDLAAYHASHQVN